MANEIARIGTGGCLESLTNGSAGQVLTIGANGEPTWTAAADDQTASQVPFTPYSSIAATNVQSAIQEIVDECCHDAVTIDATSNPALSIANQVIKLDLGNITEGTSCATPTHLIASDNLRYETDKYLPPPSHSEVAVGTYYADSTTVPTPTGTVTQNILGGTIQVLNDSCRTRVVRFSMQAWVFFNFFAPDGGAYFINCAVNGSAMTQDHAIKSTIAAPGTAGAASGADYKSYLERTITLAPGTTGSLQIRVDFYRAFSAALPNAGFIDTAFANCVLSALIF